MNQLTIGGIISNSIGMGLKNLASLVGALILWAVTIWIPYINVGTSIGLLGIIIAMSRGGVVSPTEIFSSRYRRYMGEFFLLMAFTYGAVTVGSFFVIIPGIVIYVAWSQALFLMLDRELDPMAALATSNRLTYGKKWTIFLGALILALLVAIVLGVVVAIALRISEVLGVVVGVLAYLAYAAIMMGCGAYIYGQLSSGLEVPAADEAPSPATA